MGKEYLKSGTERMLLYHGELVKDEELKNMCNNCEAYMGQEHDYNGCTNCQGFKFYCELKQYRFGDTFR